MRNVIYISTLLFVLLASAVSYSNNVESFSILPSRIESISVQKSSEWESLMISMDSNLPTERPAITDSTVEISFANAPEHSAIFQTANSSFSKGIAWTNGKLVIYLNKGQRPSVMIIKKRILLQNYVRPGKLEVWQALPTGLKSFQHFLPSYEPLALSSADFAKNMSSKKHSSNLTMMQSIQVTRTDASYIVAAEDTIIYIYPTPAEGKHIEALEFGDRLKVLSKHPPFYKVRYHNKEGYVYQRDLLLEAELTTAQKDLLRRLRKEAPGGVDNVVAKFGWKDDDKIVYSSYGFRDPFIEVKSIENDGINIDNLTLVGIFYENEAPMAVLSNNKIKGQSHTLYEGDSVKNGKILKISQTGVLFLLQEYGVSRRYTMTLPDKYGGIQ